MRAKWKAEHLWLYLLNLGFDPRVHDNSAAVGMNMFDKPNHGAFHVVAKFLFAKLDSTRAAEIFKDLSAANIMIPEFRKQCCKWLKEIANEDESHLLQIAPSSFTSPAGLKVISILYWLARHVMVEDLKMNTVGTNIPFAEAVMLKPEDVYMANARCRVAYNKLLQIFQKEDFVIQEYQKKAKLLVKEIKQMKTENARLEIQSCKMKQNDQNGNGKIERIQKVRSMWTLIMEMLASLKKEKELVDSVLDIPEYCAHQCILDGKKVVFRVPQLLIGRLERDKHQLCTGNTYEGENLNFLTVVQLLNEALRTLRDECCQSVLNHQLQDTEKRVMYHEKVLHNLEAKSLKIEQRRCVSVSASISQKQEDWEVKWKNFLGLCPSKLILERYPNLAVETSKCKKKPMPPKILKDETDESAVSDLWENAGDHVIQTEPPVKKEDPTEKARDELAEEFAKAVTAESPQSGKGKEMPLEDLISSLAFNSFLTRKRISRTPENLLTEIRSSWRKAVKNEGSSDTELTPTGVVIEDPVDATHVTQKAADSSFQCSILASPVSDVDPSLSEIKFQLSSRELKPQEQMKVSHIIESPISESEMKGSKRTEEQKNSVKDPEEQDFQYVRSMDAADICSEDNSRRNFLPLNHFQYSLRDSMLHSFVSPSLSSPSHEDAFLGIWNETLPQELSYIDSDKSASPESYFNVISNVCVTSGSKNKGDIKKSRLDVQSPFNTHKALEKTTFRGEEELHQMHNGSKSVSCRSDLSLAPERRERGELCIPLEVFCLDEEFSKMPSPVSLNERKYSLSSLLMSCQQLEEMAAMVQELPMDLQHKLKDKEHLKQKLDTNEPSSE
ncbi:HAUS augmin-like complex subunit 6 isoform X2 [Cuculus canorus]|uniref:HAUS augmin-like complex subunit 6 isoform X2 n=1 Tax=Cuculus canorus TaxID=55661 RepID=UPI0023AAFD49|nr:HAUS augmin-like complex subunit 6 isoform X2 [Cuculus canorus]